MEKNLLFLCSFLFLQALLLLSPSRLWAQDTEEAAANGNSESALNRLIGISTQLSILNEKLGKELQDSRQSSRELQSMLEASRKELEGLRQELETLHGSSTELLIKAENSQTELAALREALRTAESSLMSLELSFAAYREASEKRQRTLEREMRIWKWGGIAAGVLAAGFGAAFFMSK